MLRCFCKKTKESSKGLINIELYVIIVGKNVKNFTFVYIKKIVFIEKENKKNPLLYHRII